MLTAFVNGMPCHSDYWECSTQVSMETWEIDVKFVGSVWHQGMGLVASQPSLTTGILILNHGDGIKSPQLMMKLCEMVTFPKQWQKEEARMYWRTFILMVLLCLEREEYPHLYNEERDTQILFQPHREQGEKESMDTNAQNLTGTGGHGVLRTVKPFERNCFNPRDWSWTALRTRDLSRNGQTEVAFPDYSLWEKEVAEEE